MQNNILEYLEKSAKDFPEKSAYTSRESGMTWSELKEEAERTGTGILNLFGDKKTVSPVVILMEKSPECIAAFLGVLESGNFYVPIDIEMPVQRIKKIFDNLDPLLVICSDETFETAKEASKEGIPVIKYTDIGNCISDMEKLKSIRQKHIDTDPAYAIYTSGSTGVPKGVIVSHRSLIDYVENFCLASGFGTDDIAGNQVPFHFDASLIDIYCTLKMSASMVMIPIQYFSTPVKLLEYMDDKGITLIRWVPSAMGMVSAFKALKLKRPSTLRKIIFGAEAMPTKCFNYWRGYYPNATFIQIYGPTEITGVCTCYVVDRDFEDTETIPIGTHLNNCDVFLLDEQDRLIDPDRTGITGEICVRGSGLANGYINAPDLTERAFTQNPLNKSYPERIYRTGDLAAYNERGELVFASRKDFQIKHMGHRIELGEIESAACSMEEIKNAVCLFDGNKNKIILVYVSDTLDDINIIRYLKERLPRYMIPNILKKIETMPLTSGGKTDRLRLKEMFTK